MSKFEFTAVDIQQHCEAEMLEKPDFIEITDKVVICKWIDRAGIVAVDADKLFKTGLGKFWEYDNKAETAEEHIKQNWTVGGDSCDITLTVLRTV